MNKKLVKICIFNSHCTPSQVMSGNGDAILDSICTKTETDENLETGEYYFDATFLLDEEGLYKSIAEESILKVRMDYGDEIFRIAKVKSSSRNISVFARQITISETLDMWLEDVRPMNQNGQSSISWIKDNAKGKKDINVYSDIVKTSTAYYMDMNMYKALHDCEQSFMNRWGGEVKRRGYNLTINKKIGTNRGVQIRSRKNLTGFKSSTNVDQLVTRIKPKGFDGITIPGYVDSPLINNYHTIKTREIKYDNVKVKGEYDEDGFNTLAEAQAELIRLSELEFSQNNIDKIRAEYIVNFVQLEDTEEYKDYVVAERVYLGDEVDVYEDKYNINITVRAVRKKYDVLRQKTIGIELSNEVVIKKPPTISDILDKIENVENGNNFLQDAINNATDLITNGLKDSYVIHRKNEILIMDTQDINTATNVWRFNNGGLGHSSNGYMGPYSTAITQDGAIVATMISAGVFNANLIKTGVLRNHNNDFELNLDSGTVKINNNNFKVIVDGKEEGVVGQSQMTQTVNKFEYNFKTKGGNKIRNSHIWETSGAYGFGWRDIPSLDSGTYTLTVCGSTGSSNGHLEVYAYIGDWEWAVSVGVWTNYTSTNSVTFWLPPQFAGREIHIGSYNFPSGSSGQVRAEWYVLTEGDYPTSNWIPHDQEIIDGVTAIDNTGVKVSATNSNQFARINNQFFGIFDNGENDINRRVWCGLDSLGRPVIQLGVNGINPGVATYGGTHMKFYHTKPEHNPLGIYESAGIIEYQTDKVGTPSNYVYLAQSGNNIYLNANKGFIKHNTSTIEVGHTDQGESVHLGALGQVYLQAWNATVWASGIKLRSGHDPSMPMLMSWTYKDLAFIKSDGSFADVWGNHLTTYSFSQIYSRDNNGMEYDYDNKVVNVDLGKVAFRLNQENIKLREENNFLKQQQFEQDELIIENAFEIANIQLGWIY